MASPSGWMRPLLGQTVDNEAGRPSTDSTLSLSVRHMAVAVAHCARHRCETLTVPLGQRSTPQPSRGAEAAPVTLTGLHSIYWQVWWKNLKLMDLHHLLGK